MTITVEKARSLVVKTLAEIRRNTLMFFDKDKDSRDIRLHRYESADDPSMLCKLKFKNTRLVEVSVKEEGVSLCYKQKGKEFNLVERYKELKKILVPLNKEEIENALYESFIWGSTHPEVKWEKVLGVPLIDLSVINTLGKDKVAYGRILSANKLEDLDNGKAIYSLELMANGKTISTKLPLKVSTSTVLPGRYLLVDHRGETITCAVSTISHYILN